VNIYQQHHSKGDPYQLDPRLREPWLARLALLKPTAGNWIVGVQLWHFFWLYIYYIQYIIIYIYCTYIYIHTLSILYLLHAVGQPFTKPLAGRMTPSTYRGSLVGVPGFSLFGKSTKRLGNQQGIFFRFFLAVDMIQYHYCWEIIWYVSTTTGESFDIFWASANPSLERSRKSEVKWQFCFFVGMLKQNHGEFSVLKRYSKGQNFWAPPFSDS